MDTTKPVITKEETLEKTTIDIKWETGDLEISFDDVIEQLSNDLPPEKKKALKTYLGFPADAQDVLDTWKKRRVLMLLEMSDEDIQRQFRWTFLKMSVKNLSYDPEDEDEQKQMEAWRDELREMEGRLPFSPAFFNLILEILALGFLICLIGMTLTMIIFAILLM